MGLEGGTDAVKAALQQVEEEAGSLEDIAAVWLQDWSGQRNFTNPGDLPRVGLWWNWEVRITYEVLPTIENKKYFFISHLASLFTSSSHSWHLTLLSHEDDYNYRACGQNVGENCLPLR